MTYYLRFMHQADITQVAEIDREAFPTQWPPPNFQHELKNQLAHYIVVCDNDKIYERPETGTDSTPTGLMSRLKRRFGRHSSSSDKIPPQREHQIIGLAGLWLMADEAHITTIAVREAYRRQGLGELLLFSIIDLARELKARIVTLEVRASNTAAQRLYTKHGFTRVGLRKGYYVDRGYQVENREDGLVMSTEDIALDTFQERLEQLKQDYSRRWRLKPFQTSRWLKV